MPQGRGTSETRPLHGAVGFAVDFFWSQNTKEKSAKKIRRKIRRLESKNTPGVNPPLETPSQSPPPPMTPPPLPSGEQLQVLSLRVWESLRLSVSVAGLCKAPLLVEVHILLHNQFLEGCICSSGAGAQRGANAAFAGTGHGFSEMHALSIFGVKVWALNIEKKSAVRVCKTWQDNSVFLQFNRLWFFWLLVSEKEDPHLLVPSIARDYRPKFFFSDLISRLPLPTLKFWECISGLPIPTSLLHG